jgi:hypothetical protein
VLAGRAQAALAAAGLDGATPAYARAGGQSLCYVYVDDAGAPKAVLKVLSEEHEGNGPDTAGEEFGALTRLAEATAADASLETPRPLALFEEERALLMTFVAGEDLDDFLARARGEEKDYTALAGLIVGALAAHEGAVGGVVGDFHPGNILVQSPARIGFIDPGVSEEASRFIADEIGDAPAVDIGHWLAAVSATIFFHLRTSLRGPVDRLRLTLALVDAAAHRWATAEPAAFCRRAYRAARLYVRAFFFEQGSLKARALGVFALSVLALMERASLRRAGTTR